MKRFAYFVASIFILLSSCTPEVENIDATVTISVFPSATSTSTLLPTATKRPSATPEIPTASITPMSIAPVSISPLALNEFNAGTEMKRLNVIGTGTAHDIQFSPDGKRFAVATGRGIYLYDGSTFEQNGFIDVNDSVSAIAFSPDGKVLAVAVDGKTSLWNVISGKQLMSLEGGMVGIGKLVYGKGGYVAAIGGDCRGCGSPQLAMILWNAKTGRQIFVQRDIWYLTQALEFTLDGKQLLFGGQNGVTAVISETGEEIEIDNAMKARAPYNMMFSKDGSHLFITSFESEDLVVDLNAQSRSAFSFCDAYLASAGEFGACMLDQKIVVFDSVTGKEIKSIDTNTEVLSFSDVLIAMSPDGRFLAYGDGDVIRVVLVDDGVVVNTLEFAEFSSVGTGLILLDGFERYLGAVEHPDGQISLIDLISNEKIRTLKMDCCQIAGFAFAPDRRTVATMGDRTLQVWELSSGQVIYEVKFNQDFDGPIAYSLDGSKIFLTSSIGRYILEYDFQTREMLKANGFSYQYSYGDLFSADNYRFNALGNLVLWNYNDSNLLFTDVTAEESITIPFESTSDLDFPETFVISPDDKYLVIGRYAGLSVWDSQTERILFQLNGHETRGGDGWSGSIKSLMFSPQSNLLVSVGWDGTTRLWNVTSGVELRILNVCCSASITPDGRYLVTAGDGVIRVWGIP